MSLETIRLKLKKIAEYEEAIHDHVIKLAKRAELPIPGDKVYYKSDDSNEFSRWNYGVVTDIGVDIKQEPPYFYVIEKWTKGWEEKYMPKHARHVDPPGKGVSETIKLWKGASIVNPINHETK